jgi:hypothetical protein
MPQRFGRFEAVLGHLQVRLDARQQFAYTERFDQLVVGAGVHALDTRLTGWFQALGDADGLALFVCGADILLSWCFLGCYQVSVPGQAPVFSRDHEHLAPSLRVGHVRSPQPCLLCAIRPMLCPLPRLLSFIQVVDQIDPPLRQRFPLDSVEVRMQRLA